MYIERLFAPHRGWIGALFLSKTMGKYKRLEVFYLSKPVCAADKPSDCHYCYFWTNGRKGCRLGRNNCYYLISLPPKPKSECDGCPYGEITRALVGVRRRLCVKWGFVDMDVYEQESSYPVCALNVSSCSPAHISTPRAPPTKKVRTNFSSWSIRNCSRRHSFSFWHRGSSSLYPKQNLVGLWPVMAQAY